MVPIAASVLVDSCQTCHGEQRIRRSFSRISRRSFRAFCHGSRLSSSLGAADFIRTTVDAARDPWPELDGLILRIGESDGVDGRGDFISRLAIKQPREAGALLRTLLPSFEARGATLDFRTWTRGAFPVGDLVWNRWTDDAMPDKHAVWTVPDGRWRPGCSTSESARIGLAFYWPGRLRPGW